MFFYLILFGLTAYCYWHFVHKRRGLPPGPTPLPIVGNFHEIILEPPGEAVFARWRKQYGDVYTYWMGDLPIIAVNDYKLLVETFQKDGDTFAGRFKFEEFDTMVRAGPNGVIFTDGELWKEQRRFALSILREFGLGKNLMQERIFDEIHTIFEIVDRDIAAGVREHNLYDHFDTAVGSIINAFLFNYRFSGDKRAEFADLKERVSTHVTAYGHPMVFMSMQNPHFYKHLPGFKQKLQIAADTGQSLIRFFKERIDEHEREFSAEEETKDFVHAFLKELHKRDHSKEEHFFTHKQLVSMCYDLWLAGQETSSNMLAWGIAFMIHNPEVLRRCQEEIDREIGSDRIITMTDKPSLHYCNATIDEIQRMSNLAPMNLWHRATKEVTINGYKIGNNIPIVPQISVVMTDEKFFPNPQLFNPRRFLDADGKFKKIDEMLAYSIGKRACPGESLARMEIFLFFTNIINRYNVMSGQNLPSMKRPAGGIANISRYSCKLEKRVHS